MPDSAPVWGGPGHTSGPSCIAHDPDFVGFSRAFRAGRWADALPLVDRPLQEFPDEYWLHWHRAATLEQLAALAADYG